MTTETSFLQAIIDHPDDDAPRLIFADWLEEHGQTDRAEFIRVQCELANLAEQDSSRTKIEARQQELLARHEEEWLEPIRSHINDWVFYRGMLGVSVDVAQFLAHAEALARSPCVHYIDIVDHAVGRAKIEALVASPLLARVTILNLAGWYCYDNTDMLIDDEQIAMLAGSPHVCGLTTLNVRCNQIQDRGIEALVHSPHLRSLTELDIRANLLGDVGVQALASFPLFGRLCLLDLAFNDGHISETGWRTLADAPGLGQLRWLCLVGNSMNEETEQAFRARLGDRFTF